MIRISNAELEVMKIIWKKGETTSIEIIKELEDSSWSDNTIRTLIGRLVEKKAVKAVKSTEKSYTYIPMIEQNEYQKYASERFLKQLFNGSAQEFLQFFIEHEDKATCDEIGNCIREILEDK